MIWRPFASFDPLAHHFCKVFSTFAPPNDFAADAAPSEARQARLADGRPRAAGIDPTLRGKSALDSERHLAMGPSEPQQGETGLRPTPRASQPEPARATGSRLELLGVLAILFLGAFAFSGLVPYDPFPFERRRTEPLEDWFFQLRGYSPTLIFALSACLVLARRRALIFALRRPESGAGGALLLLPSAALYVWAIYTGAPDLLLIAFVLFCLGTASALGGPGGLRAAFLPAVFLLLLVPIPSILVNQVIYPLQLANAQLSAFVLNDVLGIYATTSGTVVTTADRTYQVIESCAGLRTVMTLFMAGIIYADLFQRSRAQTALLLIAAPLIGAGVNFIRVLSLMLNPDGEMAAVHTAQGIVMTVVGVLLLAGVDSAAVRFFPADRAYLGRWTEMSASSPGAGMRAGWRILLPLFVAASLVAASAVIDPWQPERNIWWSPEKLPRQMGSWSSRPVDVDKNALGSVLPNHWVRRAYADGAGRVELFVGSDDLQGRHSSLLAEKTVLPGSGYEIREQWETSLADVEAPVQVSLLRRETGRVLTYRWVMNASTFWSETLRAFLALDRSHLVAERRLILVRISTSAGNSTGGLARATQRLQAFAGLLVPRLDEIDRPEPL